MNKPIYGYRCAVCGTRGQTTDRKARCSECGAPIDDPAPAPFMTIRDHAMIALKEAFEAEKRGGGAG